MPHTEATTASGQDGALSIVPTKGKVAACVVCIVAIVGTVFLNTSGSSEFVKIYFSCLISVMASPAYAIALGILAQKAKGGAHGLWLQHIGFQGFRKAKKAAVIAKEFCINSD